MLLPKLFNLADRLAPGLAELFHRRPELSEHDTRTSVRARATDAATNFIKSLLEAQVAAGGRAGSCGRTRKNSLVPYVFRGWCTARSSECRVKDRWEGRAVMTAHS